MKKAILMLLIVLLCLSGCVKSTDSEINEMKQTDEELRIQEILQKKVDELEDKQWIFKKRHKDENLPIQITYQNQQMIITRENETDPVVIAEEVDGVVHFKSHLEITEIIQYTKRDEVKEAELHMSYEVDEDSEVNQLLVCTLKANQGQEEYSFFFSPEYRTIYEYNDEIQEELVFTSDLQEKIIATANVTNSSIESRISQWNDYFDLLYQEIGHKVEFAKTKPTQHYFKVLPIPDAKKLFEDFSIDTIYPFVNVLGKVRAVNMFVVEKDGKAGVVNEQGELVIPIESDPLYVNVCMTSCEGPWIPHSQYHDCPGEHGGLSSQNGYYQVKGQTQIVYIGRGDEGPGVMSPVRENDISSGNVDCYEEIVLDPESDDLWVSELGSLEIDTYALTGKFGVFSEHGKVTEAIYEDVVPIEGELMAVKKNGFWGYVDKTGKEIVPCEYLPTFTCRGKEIPFPVISSLIVLKNQEGKYGVVDLKGNEVYQFNCEYICPFDSNRVIVKENGEWKIHSLYLPDY